MTASSACHPDCITGLWNKALLSLSEFLSQVWLLDLLSVATWWNSSATLPLSLSPAPIVHNSTQCHSTSSTAFDRTWLVLRYLGQSLSGKICCFYIKGEDYVSVLAGVLTQASHDKLWSIQACKRCASGAHSRFYIRHIIICILYPVIKIQSFSISHIIRRLMVSEPQYRKSS